jgi:acetyl coenzyme A synthetase (ADP forming)-like protein
MTDPNLEKFFNPESIAVIGASREEEKPGHVIFKILLENRKRGLLKARVYGVNPKADYILGEKIYPSVSAIPDNVDLAVIVVPANLVESVMEDLGKKGVKAAIVITAGFSEIGNVELERRVVDKAKKFGIRIIGPNCVGVFSAWSGVDTIFLPYTKVLGDGREVLSAPRPEKGYVALISQSGAVGTAALDYMSGEGIGLSHFISVGNKADIDEVELIEFLKNDPRTRVILLYVENIKEGRKFIDIVSEVTKEKPVIALKAGRTAAGKRAAASHTAAIAGVDEIYDAAFRRSGVIRANDIEELFDLAKAFVKQPPARGNRIGIITDGGGAGVMATDMAEMLGLRVPELKGKAREELEELKDKGFLPKYSQLSNPVDLTGSATSEMFVESTKILLESDEVDAVVILALHQVPGIPDPVALAREIASIAKNYDKPVVAVDTGWSETAILERREFDINGIPAYPTPERAVKSLAGLIRYGEYLSRKGVLDRHIEVILRLRARD